MSDGDQKAGWERHPTIEQAIDRVRKASGSGA
jgi:hypothetical protein